jgi:hypothetical protein
MDLLEAFRQAGLFARLSLFLGIGPLFVALLYLYRPSERTLTVMRPLSLASIFGAIAGLAAGLITVLMGVGATAPGQFPRAAYVGLSESLVPLLMNFGLLAVAWILVTAGMLRRPRVE